MINYNELFEKSKELAKKSGLTQLELYQRFMFERILERISISKYNNNFILKGGLLLSSMFGIDNRTTKDMDTTIKGIDISKVNMVNILNEILSIDLNDNVKFDLINVTDIRADDEYGGNKYHIVGRLQNMKVNLEIDISTGDKVTPRELKYKYPLIFSDKEIIINSYNIETILSEKIETVLKRGIYNSRMKDFYDIYVFIKKFSKDINYDNFLSAMKSTFEKRNSFDVLEDYKIILNEVKENERLNNLWNKYAIKRNYAKDVNFSAIIESLDEFLDEYLVFTYN